MATVTVSDLRLTGKVDSVGVGRDGRHWLRFQLAEGVKSLVLTPQEYAHIGSPAEGETADVYVKTTRFPDSFEFVGPASSPAVAPAAAGARS